MNDINSLLDYFLKVHVAKGEGFSEEDINAHLRAFCEILQSQINRPFSDGESNLFSVDEEPDWDSPKWRNKRDAEGLHANRGSYSLLVNGVMYNFSVCKDNLINHRYLIGWFGGRSIEVGLQFIFYGAVADLNNMESVEHCFRNMRNVLIQTVGVKTVLERLKHYDVWTYLVPNIVFNK